MSEPEQAACWRLGDAEHVGDAVLEVAQAGVERVVGGEAHLVPAEVWVAWCTATTERAVHAWHRGPGHPAIPGWIAGTLGFLREIPAAEVDRVAVMMFAATANTAEVLQHGARDVALLHALVRNTWSWAFRRVLGDRRCRHSPSSLAADAVEVHRELAARAGADPEAAAVAERREQYASLCSLASASPI